ncbi:PepSY domain-containing protein [Rhodococcus sp. TAF43]|nr:PepSY domain-containing protein [Rhodococcus sp. W8901]
MSPPTATASSQDQKGGTYVWEADVIDASGVQRAVDVDAVTGRVLQNTTR